MIEIIVSDCQSTDGTASLARQLGVKVLEGSGSRAQALNRGAADAGGQVLFFLHADTIPPAGFPQLIVRALADGRVVGGAFDFQFDRHKMPRGYPRQALKLVMILNRVRFRWTRNYYGDQGIFVRREVFARLGGFPDVRLMEDVRFSRRMKHSGRTAVIGAHVRTSPRRFLARGVLRQMMYDLLLMSCESLGMGPERLWAAYNHWNHARGNGRGKENGHQRGLNSPAESAPA